MNPTLTFRAALILLVVLLAAPLTAADKKTSKPDTEAEYTAKLEQRSADILSALDLKDAEKAQRVRGLIIAQYRALRDWHNRFDAKLKDAMDEEARVIRASLKELHGKFVASLTAELSAAQVEHVKDRMTYDTVRVTYNGYVEMLPRLTAAQKARILDTLKEAREEAMDGGSSEEKTAIFGRYKGRINNYLSAEGYDLKQAGKDWAERRRLKEGEKVLLHAALRVDLNPADDRKDSLTRGWANWPVTNGGSVERVFEGVTISLRGGGGALRTEVWRPGIAAGATLSADGVVVRGEGRVAVEISLAGLAPGRHSLVTFHNWLSDKSVPGSCDITVDGQVAVPGVKPSLGVTNDFEAASAFVQFTAVSGKTVVVRIEAEGAVVLNGLELDTANPVLRARRPSPANFDGHAAENAPLMWQAGHGATAHMVFLGTDSNAVAKATEKSPEFRERVTNARFETKGARGLSHHETYFWRVDEVGAKGEITRGEVWQFRPRHLAFPTAEGYGRFAVGGRGGRVLEVTNLDDSGPGSLRAAVEVEGPRTVVFNVSGIITLESKLVVKNPFLTIAGQTAPGRGVCVRKFNLGMMGASDVIIRHLRVRPGNLSGTTLDGMGMASSDHCIIDHCSISWTLDEAFSSRGARNITLQRTLISEALNAAGHKKYPPGTQHGYAASIGGNVGSFHHNLLAHNAGRNWSLAGGIDRANRHIGALDLRNNVVFNWKSRATDGGAARVQFVNNYYKPGPATAHFYELVPQFENPAFGPQIYFVAGNVMEGRHEPEGPLGPFVGTRAKPETAWRDYTVATPWFEPFVVTHSAAESYTNVLADVGCNRPVLDEHDTRVIAEVRAGTARFKGSKTGLPGLPDAQEDVGGWENYPIERRAANWDSDHDGMPDEWERSRGLNPSDARDGKSDRDGDGYTNLEEYLGWLCGEFPKVIGETR